MGPEILGIDKLYHLIEYFILAFLLWRGFAHTQHPLCLRYAKLYAFSLAIFYGFTDEIHQYFVPKRFASIWDVVFDAIGAGLAVLSIGIILRIIIKKKYP